MGCDIHGYLEYKPRWSESYQTWSENGIYLPRDYVWFASLAGVRDNWATPHRDPRGLPADVSLEVMQNFYCQVLPDEMANLHRGRPYTLFDAVPLSRANEWDEKGYIHSRTIFQDCNLIQHPDWHTPSWATLLELMTDHQSYQSVITRMGYGRQVADEVAALEASMLYLPQARFVYWFDN